MGMVTRVFAAALLLVLVSGCVTSKTQITGDQPVSSFPASNGIIVGSFTSNEKVYSRGFYFRKIGTDQREFVQYNQIWSKNEFNNGLVYAFSLPPGEYEFFDFRLFYSTGYSESSWSAQEEFSIPFTVTTGEVSYLGEIHTIQLVGENLFGIDIPAGGVFAISDQIERDLPKLKTKFPEFDWTMLQNRTLTEGRVAEGLINFLSKKDQKSVQSPVSSPFSGT